MRKEMNHIKVKLRLPTKKCGAISCINNICGRCSLEECQLYENVLIQED